jgi:hypothetical protein
MGRDLRNCGQGTPLGAVVNAGPGSHGAADHGASRRTRRGRDGDGSGVCGTPTQRDTLSIRNCLRVCGEN